MELMVPQVRPTPTWSPTNIRYTLMGNTPLDSIPRVRRPWSYRCRLALKASYRPCNPKLCHSVWAYEVKGQPLLVETLSTNICIGVWVSEILVKSR